MPGRKQRRTPLQTNLTFIIFLTHANLTKPQTNANFLKFILYHHSLDDSRLNYITDLGAMLLFIGEFYMCPSILLGISTINETSFQKR
jgi:hypothetical protein